MDIRVFLSIIFIDYYNYNK